MNFKSANKAFKHLYKAISENGIQFDDTKAIFNCGFYLKKPWKNKINNHVRNWQLDYAKSEYKWYLSGNRNINKLGEIYGKVPKIWNKMADYKGNVNSNYGWQWERKGQLYNVLEKLKNKKETRHAAISIYDGKEILNYTHDTPCTYAIQFTIIKNKLNMSVYMRSNDLWFGFCNDQYCFSELQKMMCNELKLPIGWYYHHAHNMHIYNDYLNKKI